MKLSALRKWKILLPVVAWPAGLAHAFLLRYPRTGEVRRVQAGAGAGWGHCGGRARPGLQKAWGSLLPAQGLQSTGEHWGFPLGLAACRAVPCPAPQQGSVPSCGAASPQDSTLSSVHWALSRGWRLWPPGMTQARMPFLLPASKHGGETVPSL